MNVKIPSGLQKTPSNDCVVPHCNSNSWTKVLERILDEFGILKTISAALVFPVGNDPIQSYGKPSFICLDLPGFSEGSSLKLNFNLSLQ